MRLSDLIRTINFDNTFDPLLQLYRSNYLSVKGSSYSTLDKSFFDVYNQLRSRISDIKDIYGQYSAIMNKSCTSFDFNGIKSGTGSRLTSFCGSVSTIMQYTSQELDDLITTFYYGTLGGETEPIKIADNLWQSGEESLNSLPYFLERSSDCLGSFMGNYLQIFRKSINIIVSKSTITSRNITSTFSEISTQTYNVGHYVKNMANDLNNCNKLNDSTKCVRQFLADYSNCEDKNICASEKLQETIKNCTTRVNDIRTFYHQNMMDAKDQILSIDDDLDDWTDLVNKCITKTTSTVITSTISTTNTNPTTSTSKTVKNAVTTTTTRGTTTTPTKTTKGTSSISTKAQSTTSSTRTTTNKK
ncbi:uncharacterized protein [Chironomus tepperi]|uniref:uncharacterized protein n=1 Tax=Chironomus tepperi TaxID=113505 RepID=UPI00391FAE12